MRDIDLRNSEPPKIWDNTMLCMLNECPRKLYFFLRGFDYASSQTPVYFTFGRAFHQALLTWYSSPPTDPGSQEHIEKKIRAIDEAERLWLDEGAVDKLTNSLANLKNKLALYFDEYPSEEWQFVPQGGEVGWVWPLDSKWELGGAMDGYIDWPDRGLLCLEHKTTGEYLHPGYTEQFHFSRQITGYYWYLTQLHKAGEDPIYGALVNLITKNVKTARSKWKYPEFQRLLVKKAPWQLEEYEEDILGELAVFERYWNDWYWPRKGMMSPSCCTGGAGKSPCLFRGICRTPLPLEAIEAEAFVGIGLRDGPWEPWKRTEES